MQRINCVNEYLSLHRKLNKDKRTSKSMIYKNTHHYFY